MSVLVLLMFKPTTFEVSWGWEMSTEPKKAHIFEDAAPGLYRHLPVGDWDSRSLLSQLLMVNVLC